jgi:protein ImuB
MTLERFGIRTLGELSVVPRAAMADRFGAAGTLAHDLAHGRDTPLRPRNPLEQAGGVPRTA